MKLYYGHLILLFKRLILALALFFIARIFFLIYNTDVFPELSTTDLLWLFVVGMRFDISVILYFNMLFILMHVLPLGEIKTRKAYQGFLKWYFIIVNAILLFANLGDAIYFNFILKRSTADVIKLIFLSSDVVRLLPSFLADYWYVPLLWLASLAGLAALYPKFPVWRKDSGYSLKALPVITRFVLCSLLLGLSVIGGRGGLQKRPLSIMHASKYTSAKNVPVVLNTPFAIMTTYGHDVLSTVHYFSDEGAESRYPVIHQYEKPEGVFTKKNVVVLLLESFSREYNGYLNNYPGYTPFLDSLMEHSLVFTNAYSNGLRSIDAIPAIVSGLPILMDDPFITSVYSTNSIESLAKILNREGYQTAFFHGGNNGTMDFDGFAGYAGFKQYHGLREFNNMDHYDGYWGIFDEPFLQYVAHQLNGFEEPFFGFEFTLSSHNPYRVPKEHEGQFAEGDLRIHKVVRYTDHALRQFFITASSMPWYENTLFVIVADHPAQSTLPNEDYDAAEVQLSQQNLQFYGNTVGRFAIPLLLFSPGDTSLVGIDSTTIQQTDIMPAILDYIGYQQAFFAFGNTIFSDSAKHYAFQYANGLFQITKGKYSLMFDGEKSIALYDNLSDPAHNNNLMDGNSPIVEPLEEDLKAIIQQYRNRLIRNQLKVSQALD